VKLAIRTERGLWTNQRWQRWATIRHRAYTIIAVCLCLCGCAAWPGTQYVYLGTDRYPVAGGGVQYVVRWTTWGRLREAAVWSREEAAELSAVLWAAGRR
jgi:hypothetical protein